jgi:hypothetical protein
VARLLGERVDSWGAKDSGTGAVVALVPGETDRRHQREIPTGDGTGDTKVIPKRVLRRGDDSGERYKWSRCRRRWLQERPIGNTKGATRRYLQLSAAVERLTPSKPYPAMLGGREESSEAFTVPWSFWQMAALTVQNLGVKMEAPHSSPNQT